MPRLLAEWEPQDAVLLAWPHADSDWSTSLEMVVPVYLELVKQISRFEKVLLVAPDTAAVRASLLQHDLQTDNVILAELPTNDTWTRDCGPLTVAIDGQPCLLDFGFNGWGLKFACNHDNLLSRRLHLGGFFGKASLQIPGLVLEGGSIESDGQGTLLTTSECLLEANRNPHLDRQSIQQQLGQLLGAQHWLWLDHGSLAGDDTDSHIDTLARLAPDDTILYVRCDLPDDEHYATLRSMEDQLRQFRTRQGQPYRLLPLPWPAACHDAEGNRLPATYANFLIINGAVLVPTYADPQDQAALAAVQQAFPGREMIPIDCRALIEQHGSLHCITMQIPQGVLS